jgi:hypothetical protein
MNLHKHKTDWNGLLTLMLLPVVAFGLIYVSMHSNYDPMKLPPRAIRRELPTPSMLLDRSGPVSRDLGKGNITDQQIASLVTKMEALTEDKPELELVQDDDAPAPAGSSGTPARPAQTGGNAALPRPPDRRAGRGPPRPGWPGH